MISFTELFEVKQSLNLLALYNYQNLYILYKPSKGFRDHIESWENDFHNDVKGIIEVREKNNIPYVGAVWSQKGFGPNLYEIAMSEYGSLSPSEKITKSAKNIWKKFAERNDVITKYKDDYHKEEFLNYSYSLKKKLNLNSLKNKHLKFIGNDPYGEFTTALLEYFDSIINKQMEKIYY